MSLRGGEKFHKATSSLSSQSLIPNHLYFSSGGLESSEVLVLLLGPRTSGRAGTGGYLGWQAAPQPHSLPHGTSARSPGRGPYSRARAIPGGRLESKRGGTLVTGTCATRGPWERRSEAEDRRYSPADSSWWRKKASNVNG